MKKAKRQVRVQEATTRLRDQIEDAVNEFNDAVGGQLSNIELLYAIRTDPNEQGTMRAEFAMIDVTYAED